MKYRRSGGNNLLSLFMKPKRNVTAVICEESLSCQLHRKCQQILVGKIEFRELVRQKENEAIEQF